MLDALAAFGLPVNRGHRAWCAAQRGWRPFRTHRALRDTLPFDIDGVVLGRSTRSRCSSSLGFVTREPRWAVAHNILRRRR